MKKIGSIVILLAATAILSGLSAQNADALLRSVGSKIEQISRFEADALVKIDVEFIDIKDRKMKVKYEAPDKFTFESDGLALLPKTGMQMDYMQLLKASYTAIDTGEETLKNTKTRVVKVIPEDENSDVVLSQLWIDPVLSRIVKMKTFTRKSGSYIVDFDYQNNYRPLPDQLTVSFEINNMTLPTKAMNEIMTKGIQKPDSTPKRATVIVQYSNYKIVNK